MQMVMLERKHSPPRQNPKSPLIWSKIIWAGEPSGRIAVKALEHEKLPIRLAAYSPNWVLTVQGSNLLMRLRFVRSSDGPIHHDEVFCPSSLFQKLRSGVFHTLQKSNTNIHIQSIIESPFSSIPHETIICIIRFLDQPSLLNLITSCRFLYHLALPSLYRHIRFINFSEVLWNPTSPIYRGIYKFTCRVLSNESLAASVRSVSIEYEGHKGGRRIPFQPSSDFVDENAKQAVERICCIDEYAQSWLTEIQKRHNSEATIAILLPYLPNLKHLDIGLDSKLSPYCNAVLQSISKPHFQLPPTAFRNLNSITVQTCLERSVTDYETMAPLFAIPAIQSLVFNTEKKRSRTDATLTPFPRLRSHVEPGSSSVADISLLNSMMSFSHVEDFVRAGRHLRSLSISWQVEALYSADVKFQDFDPALLPSAPSLEKLVTYYGMPIKDRLRRRRTSRLQSLTSFNSLKVLKIGMAFIFGIQDDLFSEFTFTDPLLSLSDIPHFNDNLTQTIPPNLQILHVVQHENECLALLFSNI